MRSPLAFAAKAASASPGLIDFRSENLKRLRISVLQKAKIGILFQRAGEIDEIAVGFRRQSRIRQPRANRLRNLQCSRAFGNFLHAPIRELYMNAVSHNVGPAGVLNLSVY